MKRHISKLVALLSVLCIALLSLNYQSIFPKADSDVILATDTDATTEIIEDTTTEIIEETTTSVIEETTTEDSIALATQQDAIVMQSSVVLNETPVVLTENGYTINSQADWDNLFSGTTDSTNWVVSGTETTYLGTVPIVIDVNTDIVSSNKITVPADTQVTINFNNNKWDNSDFNLINGSLTINGVKGNALSVNTTGCSQVIINDSIIDMTNSTNCVANTVSPTEVKFNNCTINQANNYIVSATTGNKITLSECIINNGNSVLMTPFNGELNINNTTIVAKDNTANAIDMNKGTGNTIITDCTITGFNKALYTISNDNAQNPHNISVTNTKFYNNKFGIDFQVGNATSIKISNCDFILDNTIDGSAAIINKYCFSIGGSADIYVYKDITINNYDTGIETSYSSAIIEYVNCDVNNSLYGITSVYNKYTTMTDCDIVGRSLANNVYGIKINNGDSNYDMTSYDSLEEYIAAIHSTLINCTIKNAYRGITIVSGDIYIYKTEISNCNSGVYTDGSGSPFINECNLVASAVVDNNSFGVYVVPAGGKILNSTITGFNLGAYNQGGMLPIAGCKFINNKTGMHLYCTFVYGTEVTGSEIGYKGNSDSHIISCIFTGNGTGSGVVIDSAANDLTSIDGSASEVYLYYDNYVMFMEAANLVEIPKRNEISNFEIGIEDVKGYDFDLYDTYIHDCGIGLETTYCSIFDNNEIANCDIGIDFDSDRGSTMHSYADDTAITNKIHDCGTGIIMNKHFMNDGTSTTNKYHWTIYDCDVGLHCKNGAIFYMHNDIHDCKTGLILESGDYNFVSLYLHDNTEKDLELKSETTLVTYSDSMATRIINNSDSALSATIDGKGNFVIQESYGVRPSFITGSAPYFLTEDSYVYFRTSSFDGRMTFDVPDYSEGRVVAKSVAFAYSLELLYNYKVRAAQEGWVVAMDMEYVSGDSNLYLTAGCEVSYDYATNGGQSMSTLYTKCDNPSGSYQRPTIMTSTELPEGTAIPYKKGESIDLTPTATKDGYEFVGWNTDPNATTGLTELKADTKNITLYAIYKKPVMFNYKTYSSEKDYSFSVWFYNNDTTASTELDRYVIDTPAEYTFSGYSLDDVNYSEGDSVTVSITGGDIYCVYKVSGELIYYDEWNNEIQTVTCDKEYKGSAVTNKEFSYVLEELPVRDGFKANCWLYGSEQLYPGDTITTSEYSISVLSDYVQILVNSLEVVPEKVTMKPGDDTLLIAKVLPADAFNKKVVWYSENTDVATVDTFGRVYAKADGVVKIWAKTTDGSNLSDYSLITVETPKERVVTVTGVLTYPDGQAVADKTVTLKESISDELPFAVLVPREYSATTDSYGAYTINNVPVGDYTFTVADDTRLLASCNITVVDKETLNEDKIDVIETDDNASVDYKINNDMFIINIDVVEQTTEITTESTTEEQTTESTTEITTETPKPNEPTPTTGDSSNLAIIIWLLVISGMCLVIIKFSKN